MEIKADHILASTNWMLEGGCPKVWALWVLALEWEARLYFSLVHGCDGDFTDWSGKMLITCFVLTISSQLKKNIGQKWQISNAIWCMSWLWGEGIDKKKVFKVQKIGSPHCVFWDFVH